MGKRQQLYQAIEARYSLIVWLMLIWLVMAWFAPILVREFLNMIYHNRHTHFINTAHMEQYIRATDGTFIFMLVITCLMLVIGFGITVFYLYGKFKYRTKVGKLNNSFLQNAWVRLFLIIIMMLLMILISAASIFQVVCVDNDILHDRVIDLKFPPGNISAARQFAKYAYDMAYGVEVVSATAPTLVGGAFMWNQDDTYVLIGMNSSTYYMMSNTTMRSLAATDKLQLNGTVVTAAAVATMIIRDYAYHILSVSSTGVYNIARATYTKMSTYDAAQGIAFNLAANELLPSAITVDSLAKYSWQKMYHNAPTDMQLVQLLSDPAFHTGLAYGVSVLMMSSVSKTVLFTHNTTTMPISEVITAVHYCDTAEVFSNTVYFLSFVMFLIIIVTMFIMYGLCRDKSIDAGDYKPLVPEETEPYYDNPSSNWSDVTPMASSA